MSKKAPILLICTGSSVVLLDFLVHVTVVLDAVCTISVSSPPAYEIVFTEVDEVVRTSA